MLHAGVGHRVLNCYIFKTLFRSARLGRVQGHDHARSAETTTTSEATAACRRPTAMPPWPRRGLELQRATVRGAPSVRSSVHPPATLECEQRRRPVMLLWLEGFSTILAALAMLLLRPASRCQVLLPLTARPACTQPSLTAGCAPCAVGACQPLPFNHHTTRATWLGSATTCSRAAACLVHHVHCGGAPAVLTAPCPRSGGC